MAQPQAHRKAHYKIEPLNKNPAPAHDMTEVFTLDKLCTQEVDVTSQYKHYSNLGI